MLCDSHTHLDQFSDEEVNALVRRAQDVNIGMIISVGSSLVSSRRAIDLASRYEIVYAGVGLHPMDLEHPFTSDDREALLDLAARSSKVVCISETGLDYRPICPDQTWQEESFRQHIRLARELGKPIDFHAREAYDAILLILREERAAEAGAIWHYFEGDEEKAQQAIALGLYISLAKPLLRVPVLQEVAKTLPLERIVLETDSYPQPWKKNPAMRTEPSHVRQVAEKLAEIKLLPLETIEEVTTANLKRVLRTQDW